jgi:plastocyanin
MIWRSLTCFSEDFLKRRDPLHNYRGSVLSAITLSLLMTGLVPAASVAGRVMLIDSKDATVRKKGDFSGVVLWLEGPIGEPSPVPKGTRATMAQKDKTFLPHVLAVSVGAVVDFPNFDPIFHNAFSNYDGELFDVGLYRPGQSRSVHFTSAGVVRVFCNIHASMSAVIAVLPTPYFDTSRRDGSFEIKNVPPGEYRLRVFHERATIQTLNALSRKISVGTEPITLPTISVSESGYLVVPHMNKYGHEYQDPDDRGVYPGARK